MTLKVISRNISNALLLDAGINTIGRFDYIKGKKVEFPHVNVCNHCDAVQNNQDVLRKVQYDKLVEQSISIVQTSSHHDERSLGKWVYTNDCLSRINSNTLKITE